MIEFPQDGQISIQDLKAFIEAKLGEGAVTDQNLKNLFAKMEEHSFQLPNADLDAQGDSQAFIEPHKMSEVYGGKAPITEEGIKYGNHQLSLEIIRESEIWEFLSNNRQNIPFTACYSDEDVSSFQKVELSSTSNYTIPFGSAGLFSSEQDINSWTKTSASLSNIEGYFVGKITPTFPGGGIYLSFQANIGETYVFSAVSILKNNIFPEITANARIRIGTSPWDNTYLDNIAESSSVLAEFIPTSSTVYISITSEYSYGYNPFAAALVQCFEAYEHGQVKFGYCNVELHHPSFPVLPLPEVDSSLYDDPQNIESFNVKASSRGAYLRLSSEGTVLLDQESLRKYFSQYNNEYNCFFDIFTEQSQYEGYSTKQSFKCLVTLNDFSFNPFISQPTATMKGSLNIPFISSNGNSGFSNLSINFINSSNYGVIDFASGDANIYDSAGQIVSSHQSKDDAISVWKQNYLQEGEFYLSNSGNRLFDWITISVSPIFPNIEIDLITDTINFYQYYAYTQVRNINLSVGMEYPRHTSFPVYGTGNEGFRIKPFYYININENQRLQIEKAIQKCESMLDQFYNFNLFFLPLEDSRSGGTLAAARPNVSDSIENGLFKNKKLQTIFNLNSSTPVSYSSYLNKISYADRLHFEVTSTGRLRCYAGFNLGTLKKDHFYEININYSYDDNDFVFFINVCVDGFEEGDKRNVGRVATMSTDTLQAERAGHAAIFQCESSQVHYIELEVVNADILPGTASISSGSNILYSNRDLTSNLSGSALGGYYVLIKRKVYYVSSVSKQYDEDGNIIGSIVYLASNYIYDTAEDVVIYRVNLVGAGDNWEVYSLQVSEIKTFRTNDASQTTIDAEPRDRINSGTIFIDQIDFNSEASNRILHDDKTLVYYIVLHEILHALGLSSYYFNKYNLKSEDGYPTQYQGYYGNLMYANLVINKLNDLGKNLTDYYYNSLPMQGSSTHLAEFAKNFNGKIQPSFMNELMTPYYDYARGILSEITLGIFEDLGYNVNYNIAENPILLELHEDTSVSEDPGSSNYDELIEKNNKRACYCDRHANRNEINH